VFLLHVGRLPLAISRIVSRNRILCEAAFTLVTRPAHALVTHLPEAVMTAHGRPLSFSSHVFYKHAFWDYTLSSVRRSRS